MTGPTESPAGTRASTEGPERRRMLLIGTGAIVAVALVGVLLVMVFGGGDEKRQTAPAVRPLALTAAADTSGIIGLDGQPAQLPQADLDAVLATVTGYLKDATVTPLSTPPEGDETTTSAPEANPLRAHFGPNAAASVQGVALQALSDAHLGFAADGVSTSKLTVAVAGIVQDGAAQYVDATIDVVMVVNGEQTVTVARTGSLVLQPIEGGWKITAYRIDVARAVGDQTTTSEAAFG